MPIDQNYEGNIRVETNVGGDIVDLEQTDFRAWQYGRNQQREPRRERLQHDAAERSDAPEASQAQQVEPSKPPTKRKRRTKAEIEADKQRDQKLKEAHDKDLKSKNLK